MPVQPPIARSNDYATRRGKPHCEAFPSLDSLAIVRHAIAGRTICEWTNEEGQGIGFAHIQQLTDFGVTLACQFFGTANIEMIDGTIQLDFESKRLNPDVNRRYIICPVCRRTKQTVFLVKSSWACRTCHGLVFVSQRLSAVNKAAFRDRLKRRPGSSSLMPFDPLPTVELPRDLRHRSTTRWPEIGEQPALPSDDEHATRGWMMGDAGGLDVYHYPKPLTIVRSETIGTPVLYKPLKPILREWIERQDATVFDSFVDQQTVSMKVVRPLLEAAIELSVLTIRPGWYSITEGQSDDGFAELSATTAWEGEAYLWLATPRTSARVPLRVILDDDACMLTLRVRSLTPGPTDLSAALASARAELDARLAALRAACERFNEERPAKAQKYLSLKASRQLSERRRAHLARR